MSARHMNRNFIEHELTDDEDSESDGYVDDFRSMRGRRGESSARSTASRRSRQNSAQSSVDLEDDSETFSRGNGKSSARREVRRSNSLVRSVQNNWPAAKPSGRNREASVDFPEPTIPLETRRTVYDSPLTPDSESETGTRALVQAKIREKLAQQSSLDESSSDFWKPNTTPNVRTTSTTNNVPTANLNGTQTAQQIEKEELSPELVPDSAPTGPPPSAPDHQWECEFCTFVNEPQTTICVICCKTPTNVPMKVLQSDQQTTNSSMSPPPLPRKSPPKDNVKSSPPKVETKSSITTTSSKSKTTSSSEDNTSNSKSKGRIRKISFWPGTKSK